MDPVIELHRIGHDYGRGPVLEGIDLAFATGAVTAVCGPNAAGKTTLLRIASGLLSPGSGEVRLEGTTLGSFAPIERARRIAHMSQRFECASGFPVRRVLELARVLVGRAPEAIDRVIDELELEPLLERGVGTLSVGQAQRVALARALAQLPADGVLLLDEPLAALDPRWQRIATTRLAERARAGATIILSVHELPTAAGVADRVALLADGGLVAEGPAGEVLVPDRLARAYGVPFELLRSADGTPIPIASPGAGADTLSS